MKYFVSMLAIASALAVASPAVSQATTEADCEAAGGTWDAATGTCKE